MKKEEKKKLIEMIQRYGKYNWSDIFSGEEKYKIKIEDILGYIDDLLQVQREEIIKKLPKWRTDDSDPAEIYGFNVCLQEIHKVLKEI